MKKQLFGLSVLAFFLSASAFAAGPVANIQVTGDIKPPTCTVNGGDNDILFDFGQISPSVIGNSTPYALPSITSNISINCDAMTYLSFKSEDSYSTESYPNGWGSSRKAVTFAIVDSSDSSKTVGGIVYDIESPMVDGVDVNFSRGNDGVDPSAVWGGSNRILKGATMGWTTTNKDGVSLSEMDFTAGKVFSGIIKTSNASDNNGSNTYILSKNQLLDQDIDISQGVDYISQAILTFSFGV